ncbi:hypothetical protein CBL_05100 [Carabus blaptoides fortunei]
MYFMSVLLASAIKTNIDVPVEFHQLISKTVPEQKKNKRVTATKLTVDVSTQAEQRSSEDKMISTDVELVAHNMIHGIVPQQDQPNPPDACSAINVVRKPTMVDASAEDKICNTECQCQANTSTQMQPHIEDKGCNTDAIVQHVEFISDNMLHIFLPEQDERRPL